MSPFARRHRSIRRPGRRRGTSTPRLTLALLAAVLLVSSGLLGAPGVLAPTAAHGPLSLVDDVTTNSDPGGNSGADNSGGNGSGGDQGGEGNQTDKGAAGDQQNGAKKDKQAAGGDSTDFPGRDKIGKAGPQQYVNFTGTAAGGADSTGSGDADTGSAGASGASGTSGNSGASTTSGASTNSGTSSNSGVSSSDGGSGDSGGSDDPAAGDSSSAAADSFTVPDDGSGIVSEEAKSSSDNNKDNNKDNNGGDGGSGNDNKNKSADQSGGNGKNDGGNQSGDAAGVDNPGAVDLAATENPLGGQFAGGTYTIRCSLSNHRNSDNPLLAPGKVNGAQHAHDYAGNNSANASSDTDTLEQSSTTCTNGDQSPVFWPVLRNFNGVGDDVGEDGGSLDGNVGSIIEPTTIDLTFHGHGSKKVEPMPLTMVLNDGAAKSATENGKGANAKYTCTGSRQLTDLYPLCPPGTQMQRVFDFPSCWNGRDTDSADHISHIVFPDADGNCEADEVPVPALRLTLSYPAVQSRTFAIDSFPQEQHNPITDHALMEYLSSERRAAEGAACINAGQRCVQGAASNVGAGGNGTANNGSSVGFLDPQDRVPPSRNFTSALATHASGHDHYSVDLPGAPTLGRLLGGWQLDVLFAGLLVVLLGGYAAAVVVVRHRGRRWPWPRVAAWAGGCALVTFATCSGWASYAEAMFSVHMAQHMTLLLIAPILLVLGAPVTLARIAAPALTGRVGARLGRVPRVVLHPAAVLGGVLAADWGLYFSGLFSASLTYHWTHSLIDLAVLALGGLFAYAVLAVDPLPHRRSLPVRLGLLLAAMPAHVGFALAVGNDPHLLSASFYRVLYLRWVPSVIADQHTGGAVAAAVGELGLLVALVALLLGAATASGGALSGPYSALARRIAGAGHRPTL